MSNIRVACTAISKRINAGRVNKAGDSFIGVPVDVTSDCMKAVIEKVGPGHVVTVTEAGKPAYEIEVRDIRTKADAISRGPIAKSTTAHELAATAKRMYSDWADQQGVHCNRFPEFSELSRKDKCKWILKARALLELFPTEPA